MNKITRSILFLAIVALLAVSLATPRPAEAFIHEIIGALCSGGEIIPPGQVREGETSFVRALQATGFIVSILPSGPNQVTITFDPDVPNSKFMSAGFDLVIPDPDGDGPETELVLSPLPIPDPAFPAHANCPLFPGP